ncbi:hypothetical protein ABIE73_001125 [Bradyrhizobium yuanmingense]
MVLTPGVCASRLAVMRRPNRVRASEKPQGDGGNSAALPEESTKDTVKTIRAGKAGRPATPVVHPVCISLYTDSGAAGARPSLRPPATEGRKQRSKARAKSAARTRGHACIQVRSDMTKPSRSPACRGAGTQGSRRHGAPALLQAHILQLGEHAGGDGLRDDHELTGEVRRHRARKQQRDAANGPGGIADHDQ